MNTNGEVTIRGYRILRPELTTWNRLLDARDLLRAHVTMKLSEQINLIEADPNALQDIREWMQVSDRHMVTRREVFNWIKHAHDASMWIGNWKMVLHVYPVANMFSKHILIRVESGAILDQWYEWFVERATHDDYEDLSYPSGDDEQDEYREQVWEQEMNLTPHPFRLTVCDDLQEFATACV